MHSLLEILGRFATAITIGALLNSADAGEFRVGAAAVSITPAPGTPLAGYYQLRSSTGVLDELYSKALVFDADGSKAAIVVCDLITLPRPLVIEARELIEHSTGIPANRVLIAATHTHTAPVLPRSKTRDDFDGASSAPAQEYARELPKRIAQSVTDANERLVAARLSATKGREDQLAFNRRYWTTEGSVMWNPPKLAPNVTRPAGPIDPEVGIFYAEADARGGQPVAVFVNYGMHPDTTGGEMISADYPGVLARQLANIKGAGMLTIFANGCCGNVNHRNLAWNDAQKGPGEAQRCGIILAAAVARALPALAPITPAPLRASSELVKLPLPELTEADLVLARETLRRIKQSKTPLLDQVKCFQTFDVQAQQGEPYEVEVQVIALGQDAALVSLPGEMFAELGLAIKAASPFPHTYLIELANGAIGYIPNRSAYAEGNYEPVSARCAAGSGEMLVESAVRQLKALHGG